MSSSQNNPRTILIRDLRSDDCPVVVKLIAELQTFLRFPGTTLTSEHLLRDSGLLAEQPFPYFRSLIAEIDNEIIGYVIYYFNYSSADGKILFIEDIYVRESARGTGAGKKLLKAVARRALSENCKMRLETLDWNKPTNDFYIHHGSKMLHTRDAIRELHEFDLGAIAKLARD